MRTEDAGPAIARIVAAMAGYQPDAVPGQGVTRCQFCGTEHSVLDRPRAGREYHAPDCVVREAQGIIVALSKTVKAPS